MNDKERLRASEKKHAVFMRKHREYLRTLPLSEVQAEIIMKLNKRPAGERSIYIESEKPIRKELKVLMDAGYIERGQDSKYFLNNDGHKKLRWAEIGIAKTARNLKKKQKKDRKDIIKKWKEELPKLKKKREDNDKKLMAMYDSVSSETKKAYRNNRFLYEGHSDMIECKDEKGLRTMKAAEAFGHRASKVGNKIYRIKGAIERTEKALKGISTKRVYKETQIEIEWREQRERNLRNKMDRIHRRFKRSSEAKRPRVVSDIEKYNAQRSKNLTKKMMDLKDLHDKVTHPDSKSRVMNEIKKIKKSLQHK